MRIRTKIAGTSLVMLLLILFYIAAGFLYTRGRIRDLEGIRGEVTERRAAQEARHYFILGQLAFCNYRLFPSEENLGQIKYAGKMFRDRLEKLDAQLHICRVPEQLVLLKEIRRQDVIHSGFIRLYEEKYSTAGGKDAASVVAGLEETEARVLDGLDKIESNTEGIIRGKKKPPSFEKWMEAIFPSFTPVKIIRDKVFSGAWALWTGLDLDNLNHRMGIAERRFILTGLAAYLNEYMRLSAEYDRQTDRYVSLLDKDNPEGRTALSDAKGFKDSIAASVEEAVKAYRNGDRDLAKKTMLKTFVSEQMLDATLDELYDRDINRFETSYESLAPMMEYTLSFHRQLLGLIFAVAGLAFIFNYFVINRMVQPIKRLKDAARKIALGDWKQKVYVRSRDEIYELAESFNMMSRELEEAEAEKTRLIAELERSNGELRDFVHVASHDLQAPLRKVISFSALIEMSLKERLKGDDLENLRYIVNSARHMQRLIEDLLKYSRVATKGNPPCPVDFGRVLKDVLGISLAARLDETGGKVLVSGETPAVMADETQLHQLLQNLIDNALKYHRDGVAPEVTVSVRREGGPFVKVEVTDNGIGIESRDHEKIFTMFQRLQCAGKYEGTGIGLAICQRIVNRHGGDIGVCSAPGKGATFWFTLPAAGAGELPARPRLEKKAA